MTKAEKQKHYKKKTQVYWKWLGRKISGVVVEIFFEPVTQEIKGKKIKRNASSNNPAYLVQSDAGNLALKLHIELFTEDPTAKTKTSPKMFG